MTKFDIVKYKGINNCIRIYNEFAELIIPTEFGIRILLYKLHGSDNIFKTFDKQIKEKDKNIWQIFGGHRLWIAPESFEYTYEIDCAPLESYKITDNGVEFIQKTDSVSKIKKQITVKLEDDGSEVIVTHKITNTDIYERKVAAWGISVMRENGFCSIKTYKNDKNPLDISTITVWPFSKMNDKRVYWGDRVISLKNNPKINTTFKFGLFVQTAKAIYITGKYIFKKEFICEDDEVFPDLNCNYENYVCGNMIECESLSPLKTLKKGESLTHTEKWSLFQTANALDYKDEENILKLLDNKK